MASAGSRSVSKRFKWSVDLSNRNRTISDLPSPPAYNVTVAANVAEAVRETDSSLITKRSWDIALQPLKQVPMQLFMMYMVGNSISIFPIMMIGMMFVRPIRALFSLSQPFKMLDSTQGFAIQKLIFLLGQLVGVGLALYKCQSMGLLPTHSSDWLAFIEPQQRIEYSGGGQILL